MRGSTSCHLDNNDFLRGKTLAAFCDELPDFGHAIAGRAHGSKTKLRIQLGDIGNQRNIRALKGIGIQPADNILHNQSTQPFSLVRRIDRDADEARAILGLLRPNGRRAG